MNLAVIIWLNKHLILSISVAFYSKLVLREDKESGFFECVRWINLPLT